MNIPSEIYKIRFDQSTNKYKLIFKQIGNSKHCTLDILNSDAKNIALSKENISSSRLKTYNLILDILSILSIKIDKAIISKKGNNIISTLYLLNGTNKITIDSNFVDSIILTLKSFSILYLHESFYSKSNINFIYNNKKEILIKDNINKFMSDNAKVKRLKKTLNELVQNENYESAAIVRDRIDKISKFKEKN